MNDPPTADAPAPGNVPLHDHVLDAVRQFFPNREERPAWMDRKKLIPGHPTVVVARPRKKKSRR